MWQRGVLRVGGQPFVDEPLDDPAPSERAPDIRPPALRLEIAEQARVVRVSLATAGNLGLDLGLGNGDPFRVGDDESPFVMMIPPLKIRDFTFTSLSDAV